MERTFKITNRLGLHARPAAKLAQIASKYKDGVKVIKGDLEVNGKSVMGLMMLAAEQGSLLRVVVDGPLGERALGEIGELIERKFDED